MKRIFTLITILIFLSVSPLYAETEVVGGPMMPSTYDTDANGTVDDSEALEGTDLGTLTDTKICTYDLAGTEIDCNTDESDPQVNTLTNTKWCTTDGSVINCTQNAPSTSYARSCTQVVCASDAEDTTNCDYTCDGTADEVQIQAAINALAANCGNVYLTEGTFTLAAPITAVTCVSLIGSGWGTEITTAAAIDLFQCSAGKTDIFIRDIMFDGNSNTGMRAIELDDCDRIFVDHVYCKDMDDECVQCPAPTATGCDDIHVTNSLSTGGNGPIARCAQPGYGWVISDNTVDCAASATYGIYVRDGYDFVVSDNSISGSCTTGMMLEESYFTTMTGNTVTGADSQGIWVESSFDNVVANNVVDTVTGGTGIGFQIFDSERNLIQGNLIQDSGADGMILSQLNIENYIVDNYIRDTSMGAGEFCLDIQNANNTDNIIRDNVFDCPATNVFSDSGVDTLAYVTEYIPVGYMIDGASAPAAKSTLSSTRKVDIRDFDDAADEDLEFNWQVPADYRDIIQWRAVLYVSNATGPSAEGVSFFLQGCTITSGEALGCAAGTAVESNATSRTDAQYDVIYTGWSSDVTLTGIAAGEMAQIKIYRDVSDADDDYAQDIGLAGIELRYINQ